MGARFGPAGAADSFAKQGFRASWQMPEYLSSYCLNAFEYQCGHGVRVSEKTATPLRKNAQELRIALSLHAPYYISLSSVEEEKRQNSVNYILQSARAAKMIGAKRIVIHSGSCGKMTREEALALAKNTMQCALDALREENLVEDVILCPETMGKTNQLGTLEEVLELCTLDERMLPCIDFGHLNARTFGALATGDDYAAVLDAVENRLGQDRLRRFHAHFSKIEYTPTGGEKRHLTFADTEYGPDFEPLMELVAKRNLSPVFICESAGTQTEDAQVMKQAYERFLQQGGEQ